MVGSIQVGGTAGYVTIVNLQVGGSGGFVTIVTALRS